MIDPKVTVSEVQVIFESTMLRLKPKIDLTRNLHDEKTYNDQIVQTSWAGFYLGYLQGYFSHMENMGS